jgi:ferrochelatase
MSTANHQAPTSEVSQRVGVLLINLGTPDSPQTADVRRYLAEFLMDGRVLSIPAVPRWLLLHGVILRTRPAKSAEAYRKVWTERGSPLLFHTEDLAVKVQERLGETALVRVAMRYGQPSIGSALEGMRSAGIDRIVAIPLYPQYSSAATGSSIAKLSDEIEQRWSTPFVQVAPPFYDHPTFIRALTASIRPVIEREQPDHVLWSYHGLPESHCKRTDDTAAHCLQSASCCDRIVAANRNCYRAQCYATTRALDRALGLGAGQSSTAFQSRLAGEPWIKPYTDERVVDLARRGVKRLVVATPSFVADCLETLEEIGLRADEDFRAAGGEKLTLVPCLNSDDAWADAVVHMLAEASGWLAAPRPSGGRAAAAADAPIAHA